MGCNSGSGASTPTFAQLIQSTVTAVSAISDLAGLAADFAGMSAKEKLEVRRNALNVQAAGGTTVLGSLTTAMSNAKPYCSGAFKAQFGTAPTGTDSGVVLNYSTSPNLDNVVQVIAQNFSNWGISVSSDQILNMAQTMAEQVDATLGAVSSSWGNFSINANQTINWTIAYGTFSQTDAGVLALVYGFSAAEVGGF